MDMPILVLAALCACLGIMSHAIYFSRGEHALSAHWLIAAVGICPSMMVLSLALLADMSPMKAARVTFVAETAYVGSVFASMAVYRAFLHPLRNFPGPKLAALSQIYHFLSVRRRVNNYKHIHRLHVQYGDYVRVGPNLLSVADPNMAERIHSQLSKADWYDIGQPLTNLAQIRDRSLHARRRRHGWDEAFSMKALRAYDLRVVKYADQLVSQIHARSGDVVSATDWLHWYAFDVMGDLAFGRSFGGLEKGQSHIYIKTIHETSPLPLGCLGTMPWLIQVMMSLVPDRLNAFTRLIHYSSDCIEERKRRKPTVPDIMSPIIEAGTFFPDAKRDQLLLVGDARLLIIAGSDTVASTLIHSFYHLARDPSLVRRIRQELNANFIQNDGSFSIQKLQHLEYLNAFIQETLRMHPTNPGGLFRQTPPGGVTIGGHFLPGGVKVVSPHYTVQRSPKAFTYPDEFIPERWTTRRELVLNKNAWCAFSFGRFACIGKNLAFNELGTVICKMVLEFDISFGPGETGERMLEESKDVFTMIMARLDLRFTTRRRISHQEDEEKISNGFQ
ncbi:cytochrome P450 monooxygenase-like protein [Xylariaceae sp. FL0016]|nr:cytochrome P450 monooxygenase-like protein [Xylariaceae sp. FL0016]